MLEPLLQEKPFKELIFVIEDEEGQEKGGILGFYDVLHFPDPTDEDQVATFTPEALARLPAEAVKHPERLQFQFNWVKQVMKEIVEEHPGFFLPQIAFRGAIREQV
jgi:hypothetical protein